jgi:hypothetical protein
MSNRRHSATEDEYCYPIEDKGYCPIEDKGYCPTEDRLLSNRRQSLAQSLTLSPDQSHPIAI